MDKFMKTTLLPALKKLDKVLPAGQKVYIIGHTNSLGSEEKKGSYIEILSYRGFVPKVLNYICVNIVALSPVALRSFLKAQVALYLGLTLPTKRIVVSASILEIDSSGSLY